MHYHDKHIENENRRQRVRELTQLIGAKRKWWRPSVLTWAARRNLRGWARSLETIEETLLGYIDYYKLR